MKVAIVGLSARGENVLVTFEISEGEHRQRESFLLSAARVADLRLACGDSTVDCYEAVGRGAEIDHAVKRGLYLLGYGACSERTLLRKLVAKGEPKEAARAAVAELAALGYVNESADAAREAERGAAKGWGARRISEALRAKGYSAEAIQEAMDALEDAGVDYVASCARQIQARGGAVPTEPAEKQKLIAALTRYGFSSSEIREAIARLRTQEE